MGSGRGLGLDIGPRILNPGRPRPGQELNIGLPACALQAKSQSSLMKTASVTQSKNGLSGLLRSVRAGQSVLILDRDVPVARLEPVAAGSLPDEPRLQALERQGLVRRNPSVPDLASRLSRLPAPKARPGRGALASLLAERREEQR